MWKLYQPVICIFGMTGKPLKSANWRIVIPNLTQYTEATPQQLLQLKQLILQRLKHRPQDYRSHIKSQFDRGLRYYRIALEHHANGVPHLDILLLYANSIRRLSTDFKFLYKQGHVTTYRKLNQAILQYGKKQDQHSLHNFPTVLDATTGEAKQQYSQLIQVQQLKKAPYRCLELQMLKDPLDFNLQQYVRKNDLAQYLTNWSNIKTKLKDMQVAAANLKLRSKSGFKYIDRALIEANLNSHQLHLYDSWPGYQTIVNYLNQIVTYGYKRPMKTLNLLITGAPNTGKTSLFLQDLNRTYNCVQAYVAIYPMGTRTWWPNYKPQVYKLIYWNQAKLTSYSYDTILKVLEGSQVDLPYKGGSVLKYDNPLVIMSSNLTLNQMIQQKFGYNPSYVQMARKNLAVRIQNVIVPHGYNLFLLQKLLTPVQT